MCERCGRAVEVCDGIPLLVRDYDAIAQAIERARAAGRAEWYAEEQAVQLTGPYRHHVRKRRAYTISVLERFERKRPGRLIGLDLGCGDGENLAWLSEHVTELYASDYNLVRLARARVRGRGIATVVLADVTDYPAADDAFDVIFFNHVIEHISDDVRALREVRRILAPDGIVVLGTPNEGAAFWRLAYRLQPRARWTTDHVHFYTAKTLAERCEEAGLVVRRVDPIGWGIPHWGLDARIRGIKAVDDALEVVGRRLVPSQATSLYAVLTKR